MVKAYAPRRSRGGPRARLAAFVLGVAWPMALLAQPGPPAPRPKAAADAPPAAKAAPAPAPAAGAPTRADAPPVPRAVDVPANKAGAPAAKKGPAEPPKAAEAPQEDIVKPGGDVHRDKRAEAVIQNIKEYKPIKSGEPPPTRAQVEQWAQGAGIVDKNKLDYYVRAQAAAMTSQGVLNGLGAKKQANADAAVKANEDALKAIERAFDDLIAPVTIASRRTPPYKEFLRDYAESTLKVIPELLANHLVARIEGMIVLSRTGDERAVPTYIAQLRDPKQVIMVKILAAEGLTNVVRISRQVDAKASLEAAIALNEFLNAEKDAIWWAHYRALEALGWLRQPATNPVTGRYDMIETAESFLADPKVRPEVRAWAAWAIGMMRVDNRGARINYTKIAGDIGKLAASLGDRILAVKSVDPDDQAHELIALVVVPLYNALKGEPEQSRSGLINANALGNAAAFVQGLEPLVKAEAIAAKQLGLAAGQQQHKSMHDALELAVKKLKDYLAQNPQQVVAGGNLNPGLDAAARPAGAGGAR